MPKFSLKEWVKENGVWNKGLLLKPLKYCRICKVKIQRKSTYCRKCSPAKLNLKNGRVLNWKGDDVGYIALHQWIKKIRKKPKFCEHCGKRGEYKIHIRNGKQVKYWNIELANKSQKYLRDKSDWLDLCRVCHIAYDRTIKNE